MGDLDVRKTNQQGIDHIFAREGSKVLILARRETEGLKVQKSIRNEGGECTFVQCDVGDPVSVDQAIEKASSIYGAVHILFNNAGHGGGGDFPNSTTEEWNSVINDNLNGTFYVSRATWPHLIESGGGAVVNMSSLAAQRGFSPKMFDEFGATAPSYSAAKAQHGANNTWTRVPSRRSEPSFIFSK